VDPLGSVRETRVREPASPEELTAAVQGALEGRLEFADSLGGRDIRYRGSVHGGGFELWSAPRGDVLAYVPHACARVEPSPGGSRVRVTLRPRWDHLFLFGLMGVVALVLLELRDGRVRGMVALALFGILHLVSYLITWLHYRGQLVLLVKRLCDALL
jgi:hypothetical protein